MPRPTQEDIRAMHARGDSGRDISRLLGISRNTVARYVSMEDMSPRPPTRRGAAHPATDAYEALVAGWIEENARLPRKQRRTARRVFDELVREHGYPGSLSSVERLVRRLREDAPAGDGYLELVWPAGVAQAGIGHAVAVLDGERVELHVLVMAFPQSNARFCVALMSEAAECLCAGLRALFEHVGGVPSELVLDNATEAGRRLCGVVRESSLFSQFRAHYGCRSTYCNPYAGHEKGSVENAVGFLRRNLMSPPPSAPSLDAPDAALLEGCDGLLGGEHYRRHVRVSELMSADRAALLPLPGVGFDAVRWERRRADKQGCVVVGDAGCCAGPYWHGRWMLVGMRASTVELPGERGRKAARLPREWSPGTTVRDPSTLVPALVARPRAWLESPPGGEVPGPLRDAIDRADDAGRRRALRAVASVSELFGFEAAVSAAAEVCSRGAEPEAGSVEMVARRMLAVDGDAGDADLRACDGFPGGGEAS